MTRRFTKVYCASGLTKTTEAEKPCGQQRLSNPDDISEAIHKLITLFPCKYSAMAKQLDPVAGTETHCATAFAGVWSGSTAGYGS